MNVHAIEYTTVFFKIFIDNSIEWSNLSLYILHIHRYNYFKNYNWLSRNLYISKSSVYNEPNTGEFNYLISHQRLLAVIRLYIVNCAVRNNQFNESTRSQRR